MRRLLCRLMGAHEVRGPRVKDGRLRLVCEFCGWQSDGVETLGQQRQREREWRIVPRQMRRLIDTRERRRA